MKKYIGAKYLGGSPVSMGYGTPAPGKIINPGDIVPEICEREATARADFEPIYETETKMKKTKYSEDSDE